MKRLLQLSLLGLILVAPAAFAQESPAQEAGQPAEDSLAVWKWANFVLLVGGLGYLIGKGAGPFFAERSRKIREDMAQAHEMWKSAEARASEVERKLANLEAEIAAFRVESQEEAQSETRRMRLQTAAEVARVKEHAQQEIAAAGKAARLELKRYSAELAIGLAQEKVRRRITPDTQDALVRGFVRELDHSSDGRAS
jgi:F-type H+-transporting ATPase subunit b